MGEEVAAAKKEQMMRFEYVSSIKHQISRESDKAKMHGRRIARVWLTEDEWNEFFNSLSMAEIGTVTHTHRGHRSPIARGMWEGVEICVCSNVDDLGGL